MRAKRTKKKEDWAAYKNPRRKVRENAEEPISPNVVSDDQTGNPKTLYSFIKSKKCDASGFAPLTSNGVNYSDSVKKANTLCLHRIGP